MSNSKTSSVSYVYGLDVIRFLCALMVALFHLTWRRADSAYMMPLGWIGVQVFFVISGVVIANSAALATPSQFLKGRFMRLYPVAWVAALVNGGILLMVARADYQALGVNVVPQAGAFVRSFTLFADYFLASAYWTLPIELAFYGVIFTALCLGGRNHFRLIARLLIVLSAVYAGLLFLAAQGRLDAPWLDLGYGLKNALLVRHGSYFAIGMYLWLYINRRTLGRIDGAFLLIALCACVLEMSSRAAELAGLFAAGDGGRIDAGTLAAVGSAAFFAFAGLIFLSLRHASRWIPAGRAKDWLRMFGLMTYPFYLVHEAVGGAILHWALQAGLGTAAGLGGALLVVGAVAYGIAAWGEPLARRWIGKPVDQLMRLLPDAKDIGEHPARQ